MVLCNVVMHTYIGSKDTSFEPMYPNNGAMCLSNAAMNTSLTALYSNNTAEDVSFESMYTNNGAMYLNNGTLYLTNAAKATSFGALDNNNATKDRSSIAMYLSNAAMYTTNFQHSSSPCVYLSPELVCTHRDLYIYQIELYKPV